MNKIILIMSKFVEAPFLLINMRFNIYPLGRFVIFLADNFYFSYFWVKKLIL
jgi:hypothetical protein